MRFTLLIRIFCFCAFSSVFILSLVFPTRSTHEVCTYTKTCCVIENSNLAIVRHDFIFVVFMSVLLCTISMNVQNAKIVTLLSTIHFSLCK